MADVLSSDYAGVTDDDRPALQAALDAAGPGGRVVLETPPRGYYLLGSATQQGDRILRTHPDQTIEGPGGRAVTLKVAPSFGPYRTVIGQRTDSTYCGDWTLRGVCIDQAASADNALPADTKAAHAHPRAAVRLGSYKLGSSINIQGVTVVDSDSVNTLYLYGDVINVYDCDLSEQGGPVGTPYHDHSTIYTTTTTTTGRQLITRNLFRGVIGSGGSRTGIETHGGDQTITDNTVVGYAKGANLTGVTPAPADFPTRTITFCGNTLSACLIGTQLWSWTVPNHSVSTRDMIVSDNTMYLDRDAWSAVPGLLTYASGILVEYQSSGPIGLLAVENNTIIYAPAASAPPAWDYHSAGINIDVRPATFRIEQLIAQGNLIVRPFSAGVALDARIASKRVNNTVVSPGQSTDTSVTPFYRSDFADRRP